MCINDTNIGTGYAWTGMIVVLCAFKLLWPVEWDHKPTNLPGPTSIAEQFIKCHRDIILKKSNNTWWKVERMDGEEKRRGSMPNFNKDSRQWCLSMFMVMMGRKLWSCPKGIKQWMRSSQGHQTLLNRSRKWKSRCGKKINRKWTHNINVLLERLGWMAIYQEVCWHVKVVCWAASGCCSGPR